MGQTEAHAWFEQRLPPRVQDRKPEKKRGVLSRMFGRGRRKGEHESFSNFAPVNKADREDDSGVPNIVILNSLTHNQLMELLKVGQHWLPPSDDGTMSHGAGQRQGGGLMLRDQVANCASHAWLRHQCHA